MRQTRHVVFGALVILLGLSTTRAQSQEPASHVWAVFKQVAADSTTYAPAAVSFTAERLDWASSQTFFEHGYLEQNPQFTISGRPNDVPLSYAAGKRVIVGNALADLGASAMNNVSARVLERILVARYPHRKKLVKAIGWIERISFATTLATVQSKKHFHQWRYNVQTARELGFR